MIELFKIVLSLSLSGSLLIIALLLCKPLTKNVFSKRCQYYIWLIVAARLLLPFAPQTNLMGTLFQHFDFAAISMDATSQTEQEPSILPESNVTDYVGVPSKVSQSGGDAKPENLPAPGWFDMVKQNIVDISVLVWFIAAIGLLIRKVTVYQSFVKYIKAGQVEISDIRLWDRVGKLLEQNRVKKAVGIYTNSLISSPLLIGFFHPCIMLPTTELSESDFIHTILHELTHYKRRDMFYKWLVQATICLHWFNPLVYLMGREVNRACELSCDEAVIKPLDAEGRRAYGDTLLYAMGTGGPYNDPLAAVTLSESAELLKERLDSIMEFKKTTRLATAISVVFVFTLCFGATAAGAYTNPSAVNQPDQNKIFPSSSLADSRLNLVEHEYTLSELDALDISGIVVEAFSENVFITGGGDTLKFEYYTSNQNKYTLQRQSDGGQTRWNLVLARDAASGMKETARPISITVPNGMDLNTIIAATESGDIRIQNCETNMFMKAQTQSGQVFIYGGSAKGFFEVETNNGNALVTRISLLDSWAKCNTESGTIAFQPANGAENYCFEISAGSKAQVTVNGKEYPGGIYEINPASQGKFSFESQGRGALVVQDLSLGKLSIDDIAAQPVPADKVNLSQVKKEYTESDLRQMGITGLRIEATTENIIVNQGGNSLILTYDQANGADYTLNYWDYEIYHGEFTTPEDIAMNGGKSGMVKEVKLASAIAPDGTARNIYITLPSDPQYSRVVQLFSNSGNIQLKGCDSTAVISADTESGNISFQSCSSPRLEGKSASGNIEVSGCTANILSFETIRGYFALDGYLYQSGEYTFNSAKKE